MLKKILLLIIWAISLTLASCEDTKEPELIDCDRVCGRVFGFAIQDSDGNNLLLQDTRGSFTDKNISIEFNGYTYEIADSKPTQIYFYNKDGSFSHTLYPYSSLSFGFYGAYLENDKQYGPIIIFGSIDYTLSYPENWDGRIFLRIDDDVFIIMTEYEYSENNVTMHAYAEQISSQSQTSKYKILTETWSPSRVWPDGIQLGTVISW